MTIWKNIHGYMGYQLNTEGSVRRVMFKGCRNGKNYFIKSQSAIPAEVDNEGKRFVYLSTDCKKDKHYLDDLLKVTFPDEFQLITKSTQSSI